MQIAAKKRKQLGLAIGTASHRLRKLVLFHLVRETGRNRCHRCSRIIESADDLTLDHKKAWLDESVSLFWDIENIAFAHARCNSISRRSTLGMKFGPSPFRKVGPPGTAWCTGHQQFRPTSEFHRNKRKWSGTQSFCKTCQRADGTDRRKHPKGAKHQD